MCIIFALSRYIPLIATRNATIVIGHSILRVEANDFGPIGNSSPQITVVLARNASVDISSSILRVEANDLGVVGNRVLKIVHLTKSNTAIHIGFNKLWIK